MAVFTGLGSAASPSITFSADTNTGIFSPGANQLAISTNGTGRLFVNSTGLVGLGTSGPASELDVVGLVRASQFQPTLADSAALPGLRVYNEVDTGFFRPGSNIIGIATGGTEAARIDSSGRLLVGTLTSTGANLLQVNSDALVNGLTVGRGASAISGNTAVGLNALQSNTTGGNNTANGYNALYSNTTGNYNTADGYNALYSNTTGDNNTANGRNALYSNTTGSSNTANGFSALFSNTTGNYNTANGRSALFSNTAGNYNTANGFNALYSNTIGDYNTADGYNALYSNTTGNYNTANGVNALYSNTTGDNNTANGRNALHSNTTGSNNTANGFSALFSNTTGGNNTAIGLEAGYGDGTQANTTGANNTFIGFDAMGASSTANNVITLGNGSIATLRAQVTTITALSDERDKKNIAPLNAGLDFLTKLRPVSFTWNTRDKAKVDVEDTGFIAQELLAVQEDTGITIPNLVSQENPDKLEAGYGTLIPVLVGAVQELTAMVKQLQDEITTLKGDN